MATVPPLTFVSSQTSNAQDPAQSGLVLGNVAFLTEEHPAELALGAVSSRQAVHEMAGGYREVQDLGPQFEPVTWEGTFWDAQAETKSDAIAAMEAAGKPVTLQWERKRFSVLIAKFVPTIIHQYRIRYSITVTVLAELAGTSTAASSVSVDSQTQAMFVTAQSSAAALAALAASTGVAAPNAGLSTSVDTLGTELANAGPLGQASADSVASIAAAVASIHALIDPYITTLSTAMSALPSGLIPPALQRAYTLSTDITAAIDLIALNAGNGQAVQTIKVGGGTTLYHLAAQYLGDATLAPILKAANPGLTSMVVPNGVTTMIKIPPTSSARAA